ncbi:MAG: multiprotein-bridging factor 1 family protein [Candidatus Diapherotrites archaeon]
MECEICGNEHPDLRESDFGGAMLSACPNCRSAEKEKSSPTQEKSFAEKGKKLSNGLDRQEMARIDLIQGWGQKIRKAREQKGLMLKELGEKIFEKESTIQKIESEKIKPNKKIIEKFESFLGIHLIEENENMNSAREELPEETGGFTLGDFLKKKK